MVAVCAAAQSAMCEHTAIRRQSEAAARPCQAGPGEHHADRAGRGLVILTPVGWRGDSHLPRVGDRINQGREIAQVVSLQRMQVKLELNQAEITEVHMANRPMSALRRCRARPSAAASLLSGRRHGVPPSRAGVGCRPRQLSRDGRTGSGGQGAHTPRYARDRALGRAAHQRGGHGASRNAFFRHGRQSYVFAERNGRFTRVAVTTGASNGDYTAVKSGVREGERIALNDLGVPATPETPAKGRPSEN